MQQSRRPIFWWISGGVVALLLFGTQGFRQLVSAWREKVELDKALIRSRSDRERLTRELDWILHDPAYTEYLIRKNLGYVKKGEVEYQFIKQGKKGNTGTPKEAPGIPPNNP